MGCHTDRSRLARSEADHGVFGQQDSSCLACQSPGRFSLRLTDDYGDRDAPQTQGRGSHEGGECVRRTGDPLALAVYDCVGLPFDHLQSGELAQPEQTHGRQSRCGRSGAVMIRLRPVHEFFPVRGRIKERTEFRVVEAITDLLGKMKRDRQKAFSGSSSV